MLMQTIICQYLIAKKSRYMCDNVGRYQTILLKKEFKICIWHNLYDIKRLKPNTYKIEKVWKYTLHCYIHI